MVMVVRLAPELNIVDDDISLDVHILDHVLVEPVVKVAEMFVVHCDLETIMCTFHMHFEAMSFMKRIPVRSLLRPPLPSLHVVPDDVVVLKPGVEV